MSPFRREDRYPLRSTPERERRSGFQVNEAAEEQNAAQRLQQMRVQHDALLAEIEAARAERQAQPPPQQPPPQQPPPQQHQAQQTQPAAAVITQLTQPPVTSIIVPQPAAQQTTRQRRSGSKNYSNDELLSLLQCIKRVLPIGQDMWEMVARLHAINYPQHQRDGKSIKTKYLRLANEKPSTGNPIMPESTRLAKEIKQAIDLKVGNTNPDSEDFFLDDLSEVSRRDIPRQITAAETVPTENTSTAVTNATATNTTTTKKTRTNQIVGAMISNSAETRGSFASVMEQRLFAEESEMRLRRLEREAAEEQRRLDREEDRRRREEQEEIRRQEREERRLEREEERQAREDAEERRRRDREEERHHQQQQLLTMMQVVMSGAMAFMGMKNGKEHNNGSN